jgi:hypothetical protein
MPLQHRPSVRTLRPDSPHQSTSEFYWVDMTCQVLRVAALRVAAWPGEPGGDSAMARTVSLPAAIGVRMILHGELKLTGVHIPVVPEIYEPVLAELARLGIECKERTVPSV